MSFAQGARSRLATVVESVFGTTPGTPSMKELPFNTHSLDLTKQTVESDEIRSDRMTAIQRHGQKQAAGDIVVDLRNDDFDDLLEAAFLSSFALDVLDIGTTPKFLTIEDGALDVAQYRAFKGMTPSTMTMNIAPNAMVTTTFSMVGKDVVVAGTELGAPAAPTGGEPYDSFSGSLNEGGAAIAVVTSLSLTLENSFAPAFVVGDQSAPQLEFGRAAVSGQMQVYYEDATLINKFLNETESSVSVTLGNGTAGQGMTILIPRVKYNGAQVPVQNEQSRIITMPFVGLRDAVEGTNLRLTRGV